MFRLPALGLLLLILLAGGCACLDCCRGCGHCPPIGCQAPVIQPTP